MHKFSFFAAVMAVTLMLGRSQETPDQIAELSKSLIKFGKIFLCALRSCAPCATKKSIITSCGIVNSAQLLTEPTIQAILRIVNNAITGSLEIEPLSCDNTLITCDNTHNDYPYPLLEFGEDSIRLGNALACLQNASQDQLQQFAAAIAVAHQNIVNSGRVKNLQCAKLLVDQINLFIPQIENICS